MKWVVDRIGKTQVWYSGDVIDEIKQLCEEEMKKYITYRQGDSMVCEYKGAVNFARQIAEVIVKGEK